MILLFGAPTLSLAGISVDIEPVKNFTVFNSFGEAMNTDVFNLDKGGQLIVFTGTGSKGMFNNLSTLKTGLIKKDSSGKDRDVIKDNHAV